MKRVFGIDHAAISAMKRVLEQELLTMEIIVNPKTLPNGTNVLQLETAVGAAMKCFNGATGQFGDFLESRRRRNDMGRNRGDD